jgi:CHAT domain-containing protein
MHASGDQNPAHCLLAFYFDPRRNDLNEGLLGMKELATLSMNTDLVVLSACETARGMELVGEGVNSLSQAVLLSGARSVTASVWKVDDKATAEFMNGFYESLSTGASKAAALRSAKLKLIESKRYSHPRYWAAFVLTGDGVNGVDIRPAPWWRSKGAIWVLVIAALGVLWFCLRWRTYRTKRLFLQSLTC